MQDPDREKCQVCGKSLKKASMKRHVENVHGKAKQDKKQLKANRETAKKQALQTATKEIFTNQDYGKGTVSDTRQRNSYSVPSDIDDEKLNRLSNLLEDFEFIDADPRDSPQPAKKVTTSQNAVKKRQQPELAIQKKLEKQYNAGHKVIPYSVIDILGNDFLIEIKNWNDWIKAIGQVIVYGHVYPNHMKQIHFFGEPPPADKEIYIRAVCAKLGIKVTQEPWP